MAGGRTRYARALTLIATAGLAAACSTAGAPTWTPAPPAPAGMSGAAGTPSAPASAAAAPASAAAPAASAAAAGGTGGTMSAMPGMATTGGATTASATSSPAAAAPAGPNASAPPYQLFDPTAPAVLSGTEHDIDMPIVDKLMTVAKGYQVMTWTFGGTVPGPTIRVHLHDTVRIHLRNMSQMSHTIDFHASQTAMNHQMVEIKPGGVFTYTFTADYAGVWMYHCGMAPALMHIANGMFGMVIVEPEGGLPPVAKELAIVQSEWYLGQQGGTIDYAKANAAAPAPDFQVFNGVANQYKDNPISIPTAQRIRIFVLNVGPNLDTSFHVVGTIFDTVVKEGVALVKGNPGNWGSQAVDLAPAQGAMVEFQTAEDGMYVMVNHAFTFVNKGSVGVLQSGDGDPTN